MFWGLGFGNESGGALATLGLEVRCSAGAGTYGVQGSS